MVRVESISPLVCKFKYAFGMWVVKVVNAER